jgi:hypothetical protein
MTRGNSWKYRILLHLVKKFIAFCETDISIPPTNGSIIASWIQSTVLYLTTIYNASCVSVSHEFILRHILSTLCINMSSIIYIYIYGKVCLHNHDLRPIEWIFVKYTFKKLIRHQRQTHLFILIPFKLFLNKTTLTLKIGRVLLIYFMSFPWPPVEAALSVFKVFFLIFMCLRSVDPR